MDTIARCSLCGEPMPAGEEMFKFHGYSGNCPKPPLEREKLVRGVSRNKERLDTYLVSMSRMLTDGELRQLHDYLRSWRPDQ